MYRLQVIGEAASKLPLAAKQSHPEIDWEKITGLRHLIVHEYWRIDLNRVWDIVTRDIPDSSPHSPGSSLPTRPKLSITTVSPRLSVTSAP